MQQPTKTILRKSPETELEENLMYFETYMMFFEDQILRSIAEIPTKAEYYQGMLFSIRRVREFFLDCRTGRMKPVREADPTAPGSVPLSVQNLVDSQPETEAEEPKKKGS